jgi:hypothetical protein
MVPRDDLESSLCVLLVPLGRTSVSPLREKVQGPNYLRYAGIESQSLLAWFGTSKAIAASLILPAPHCDSLFIVFLSGTPCAALPCRPASSQVHSSRRRLWHAASKCCALNAKNQSKPVTATSTARFAKCNSTCALRKTVSITVPIAERLATFPGPTTHDFAVAKPSDCFAHGSRRAPRCRCRRCRAPLWRCCRPRSGSHHRAAIFCAGCLPILFQTTTRRCALPGSFPAAFRPHPD